MVKTNAPPPPLALILTPGLDPAGAARAAIGTAEPDDADPSSAEDAKQADRNAAGTKTDAFEGAARSKAQAQAMNLTNALTAGLSSADAARLLGDFAKDALIGDIIAEGGAAGLSPDVAALQNMSIPQLDLLLEGVLGQLVQLAQTLGQPLHADALTLLATLNGQPASLLDAHTEATTLWRALALANKPLGILTLAATGHDVDAHSGLLPRQAYRVMGTFVDDNHEKHVRLVPGGPGGAPTDEESMLAQALSVPFASLQRAIMLAIIGDPRIDMPYASELDEAGGPGQANCCMFAHATGAATGPASIAEQPTSLTEPRCRSCAYARQMCLPEA